MPQPPSLAGAGWLPLAQFSAADTAGAAATFPEPFVMYLARFLVQYDERSATWFGASAEVLPSSWDDAQRRAALADSLGQFGTSLSFQLAPLAAGGARGTLALWDSLQSAYGSADGAASARLAQLFSLLAPSLQPTDAIAAASKRASSEAATAAAGAIAPSADQLAAHLSAEPGSLLPSSIRPEWDGRSYSLPEALRQALLLSPAAAESAPSAFGEMGRAPLSAEIVIPAATYGLFALSGGFGCSLTHLTVVPLDVVKTRLQTRPGVYGGFGDALQTIRKEEGWRMLFQGAQATGAGYFMYGVSVYPGYELAKRLLFDLAGPTATLEFRVPLVLLAGALATVVTCFLITPFEALRIRMVECPRYAPNFLAAYKRYTDAGGFLSLYDGLIPLLVRQVLFGMVKFLIFDTCADAILASLPPGSGDSQVVTLGVSLLSGAIAGVVASCVSQPADVVLTKVAQGEGSSKEVGVLPGGVNQLAQLMTTASVIVNRYGVGGLYRGLPSRCLWSGAIIAGQFFLYDVFKGALHVANTDLTIFYDALGASEAGASLLSGGGL